MPLLAHTFCGDGAFFSLFFLVRQRHHHPAAQSHYIRIRMFGRERKKRENLKREIQIKFSEAFHRLAIFFPFAHTHTQERRDTTRHRTHTCNHAISFRHAMPFNTCYDIMAATYSNFTMCTPRVCVCVCVSVMCSTYIRYSCVLRWDRAWILMFFFLLLWREMEKKKSFNSQNSHIASHPFITPSTHAHTRTHAHWMHESLNFFFFLLQLKIIIINELCFYGGEK